MSSFVAVQFLEILLPFDFVGTGGRHGLARRPGRPSSPGQEEGERTAEPVARWLGEGENTSVAIM